jgi:hypothetical protein
MTNLFTEMLDSMATKLFTAALAENRCGELYQCLIEGGAATVDASTGKLVMITKNELQSLINQD